MTTPAPPVMRCRALNGAMLESPVWENHYRGVNWAAVIDVDPKCPGGLSRQFLAKGRGDCLYMIDQLDLFDPVEFAADYVTTVGTKHRKRWFGVVISKTDECVRFEKCESGTLAVLRSREARQSTADRARALQFEKESLEAKAAQIDKQIEEVKSQT